MVHLSLSYASLPCSVGCLGHFPGVKTHLSMLGYLLSAFTSLGSFPVGPLGFPVTCRTWRRFGTELSTMGQGWSQGYNPPIEYIMWRWGILADAAFRRAYCMLACHACENYPIRASLYSYIQIWSYPATHRWVSNELSHSMPPKQLCPAFVSRIWLWILALCHYGPFGLSSAGNWRKLQGV